MQAQRSVLLVDWAQVLGAILALMATGLSSAEGVMITYISSTRYVQGSGITREDAVGFGDFDVSRSVVIGPTVNGLRARIEASQSSRLLSSGIEVSMATLTQFLSAPQANSIIASSVCDVVFSIDEATQVTLSTGPILAQSNGGVASATLTRADGGQDFILGNSVSGDPVSATLSAGSYRFTVGAVSDSLQGAAGPAQAIATLTIPPTTSFAALGAAGLVSMTRRPRRQ
jgi:hypothetical protein